MKKKSIQAQEGMSRRQFLAVSGWLALGATTLGTPLSAEVLRFSPELYQVTSGRITMGTFVNMALFHPSKDQAEEAMGKAFQEMDRLIDIFNAHDASTRISHLNKTGRLNELPPELYEVLGLSLEINRRTGGAFDITIKPVLDLYEQSFAQHGKPPEKEELAKALENVGCDGLGIERNAISFKRRDMRITLDGIAKGYIVDRAMAVLRSQGIEHALINAGGDICVTGPRGDGAPWQIAVQDPWDQAKTADVVQMSKGAIATSGNYEVHFDREKLYHHIITPRFGMPTKGIASVSAMAPSTMMADALSTSVFVMGVGKGKAFLKNISGVGGLIISSDQRKFHANWPVHA